MENIFTEKKISFHFSVPRSPFLRQIENVSITLKSKGHHNYYHLPATNSPASTTATIQTN